MLVCRPSNLISGPTTLPMEPTLRQHQGMRATAAQTALPCQVSCTLLPVINITLIYGLLFSVIVRIAADYALILAFPYTVVASFCKVFGSSRQGPWLWSNQWLAIESAANSRCKWQTVNFIPTQTSERPKRCTTTGGSPAIPVPPSPR